MPENNDSRTANPNEILRARRKPMLDYVRLGKSLGIYPYFKVLDKSQGTEVEVEGRRLLMLGCNDYLGLAHHPEVKEAACRAIREWGAGAGGSRFLCGNLALHRQLEERLAAWVGKRGAVSFATGFATNLGTLSALLTPADRVICDRQCHASIIDGCQAPKARFSTFAHNDWQSLERKLADQPDRADKGLTLIVTEGVFSMSGQATPLDRLARIKRDRPELLIYLDDAHGLGVMGPGGRGTAAHFSCVEQMDFIMGTFSKSLGSIGGFVAGDDLETLEFIRHTSRHLIFSAALPAANAATALASLEVLEKEPQRVERLWAVTRRAREGLARLGLDCGQSDTPIIPIILGDDLVAARFAKELFLRGVFAPPAIFPAVPRGGALVRTAFMSTHTDAQVDRALEAIAEVANKMGVGSQPAA